MNDYLTLSDTKPVYKDLNGVRLLPDGWEDEILKILNTLGGSNRHRRRWSSSRAKNADRRQRQVNETKSANEFGDEIIRHNIESSSSSSSSSTWSSEGSSLFSTESSTTKQQQQKRKNYCSTNNNDCQRKSVVERSTRSLSSSPTTSNQNVFALHALKLAFKLALKERDTLAKAYENSLLTTKKNNFVMKTDSATIVGDGLVVDESSNSTLINHLSLCTDSTNALSLSTSKLNNRETEINSSHVNETTTTKLPSPKSLTNELSEVYIEPVDDETEDYCTWEYRNVSLSRVPGYGFGIAVSGGRDNPHFKNGDPSIVVSDVLRAGPAFGVLIINDRIVSANGFNLDNADYATAVQIMKDSDHLNLVIKRRIRLPVLEYEQRTLKFTLSKSKKKDDFGVVLGCKFYIKEITNKKLADKEPSLKENDVVTSINGQRCDDLTLAEARKLLEKSKERLSLIVQRDVPRGTNWKWSSQATLYERIGSSSDTPQQSPTLRASPMVNSHYSDDGDTRLNNGLRISQRYLNRVTPPTSSMEHVASPMKRQSYGSSRSRTPNASISDDYSNGMSPKVAYPSSNFVTSPKESNYGTHVESSLTDHNQNSPCSSSEPRFVSFLKENGSVGVRVIGGNEVGIFVSAVQQGSPAFAQGVRCGDQILRVNDRDMIGVTREEAVLHLLSLSDRIDLIVQYKRDQYEYVRLNNLGDNFFIRVHFDYDTPENGELAFKKGDIFQIIDTLFGGTVGSWQAVSVVTNDKIPVKGVIPNQTRADHLIATDMSRSRRFDDNNRTGSLLRRKMTLGRRSKSLTKGRLDEIVFAQDNLILCAYERVKLKRPEFLRPVVLFGALADICREKLLQDYPLRFATPQQDSDDENNKKCDIIRLSSIKEIMNKNKHCLLDITPNSVEKLQYAQYCPIVIYLNVDSRTRLKELRKKHSKAAATKSSRKLMDDSLKIQKAHDFLFTATLDASREDEWFDGLLDLISKLQDSRIWMGETRPANILDDEFLFPLDYRYGNYSTAGESDAESVKAEHFDYRTLPARLQFGRRLKNGSIESTNRRNDHDYGDYMPSDEASKMSTSMTTSIDVFNRNETSASTNCVNMFDANGEIIVPFYENRDSFVDHFATLRRPMANLPRPKVKPLPPPRQITCYTPSTTEFQATSNGVKTVNGSLNFNSPPPPNGSNVALNSRRVVKSSGHNGASVFRQISEPGLFDVKQILADHSDKSCNFSPPPPPSSQIDDRRAYNGYVTHSEFSPCYPRRASHSETYGVSSMTNSSPNARYCPSPNSSAQPIAIINPSFQESFGTSIGKPSVERMNFVARTASMPPSANRIVKQNVNGSDCDKNRGCMPPPAPAPRSPHPHSSPRLTLPSTSVVSVSFDDHETTETKRTSPTTSHSTEVDRSTKANEIHLNNDICSSNRLILNGRTEESRSNTVSTQKRPIKSPKPPVPEKPAALCGASTTSTNLDLTSRNARNRTSAFELYNKPSSTNDCRTVLAHVNGFVGPEGGTLTSDTTGVVLKIPPGALTTKHDVFFKVFQDSRMEPPLDKEKGETLLSPLLMCGPQGLKFQKPVELLLPHCASDADDDVRWSFALKSANDAGVNQQSSNWKQIPLTDANNERNGGNVNEPAPPAKGKMDRDAKTDKYATRSILPSAEGAGSETKNKKNIQ